MQFLPESPSSTSTMSLDPTSDVRRLDPPVWDREDIWEGGVEDFMQKHKWTEFCVKPVIVTDKDWNMDFTSFRKLAFRSVGEAPAALIRPQGQFNAASFARQPDYEFSDERITRFKRHPMEPWTIDEIQYGMLEGIYFDDSFKVEYECEPNARLKYSDLKSNDDSFDVRNVNSLRDLNQVITSWAEQEQCAAPLEQIRDTDVEEFNCREYMGPLNPFKLMSALHFVPHVIVGHTAPVFVHLPAKYVSPTEFNELFLPHMDFLVRGVQGTINKLHVVCCNDEKQQRMMTDKKVVEFMANLENNFDHKKGRRNGNCQAWFMSHKFMTTVRTLIRWRIKFYIYPQLVGDVMLFKAGCCKTTISLEKCSSLAVSFHDETWNKTKLLRPVCQCLRSKNPAQKKKRQLHSQDLEDVLSNEIIGMAAGEFYKFRQAKIHDDVASGKAGQTSKDQTIAATLVQPSSQHSLLGPPPTQQFYYGKPLLPQIASLYGGTKAGPPVETELVFQPKESSEPAFRIASLAAPQHELQQQLFWDAQNQMVKEMLPEFQTPTQDTRRSNRERKRGVGNNNEDPGGKKPQLHGTRSKPK